MRVVQRHLEIDGRWGALPAVNAAASFNFFDQSIIFSMHEENDVRSIHELREPTLIFDKVANLTLTGYHEYRHWLDLTSSTYGLNWLAQLFTVSKKFRESKSQSDYIDFCRSASLFATEVHLPKYYSVLESLHDELPWQYAPTVGRAFTTSGELSENHPIWFLNYSDAKDRKIGRQPVSIASLLEARAVEAEMAITARVLLRSKLTSAEKKAHSMQQFTKEMLSRVYSPSLTLYSTAAHWYANNRRNPDVADAYLSTSRLAEFCLNAPSEWIAQLRPTQVFSKKMAGTPTLLMHKSLARKDRAALFFMLAFENRLTTVEKFDSEISEILKTEWNVSVSSLEKLAADERSKLLNEISSNSEKSVEIFLDALHFNQQAQAFKTPAEEFHKLKLPAIYLKDEVLFNLFTFKTGTEALSGNIFDPIPHSTFFDELEEIIHKHRKYTDLDPHCFAKD